MTQDWPEDAEVRRAVACWGQLLDEALIADCGAALAGLDWPDDDAIANTLAVWGGVADETIDETLRLEDSDDATIVWLGESSEGEGFSDSVAHDIPTAGADSSDGVKRMTRKRKDAWPGEQSTTIGLKVRVLAPPGTTSARHGGRIRPRKQIGLAAAAVSVVLLIGVEALAGRQGQTSAHSPGPRPDPPAALLPAGALLPGAGRPPSSSIDVAASGSAGNTAAAVMSRPRPAPQRSLPAGPGGSSSKNGGAGPAKGTSEVVCPPVKPRPATASPSPSMLADGLPPTVPSTPGQPVVSAASGPGGGGGGSGAVAGATATATGGNSGSAVSNAIGGTSASNGTANSAARMPTAPCASK